MELCLSFSICLHGMDKEKYTFFINSEINSAVQGFLCHVQYLFMYKIIIQNAL